MKTGFTTLAKYFAASVLLIGTFSTLAQQPTVILPTTASAPNGIAPNGIGATTNELLFSEPYCVVPGTSQPRGIYSVTGLTPSGSVLNGTVTKTVTITDNGCAENYFIISPGLGGFPANSVYSTNPSGAATDEVDKDGSFFIGGIADSAPGHAGITFDSVGSFSYALIVTTPNAVYGFNSAGAPLFTYPSPGSTEFLETATVAPLSNVACPGCLYITTTTGTVGGIYTVPAFAATGTNPTWVATVPSGAEPEGILFITPQVCTLNGTNLSYFVSGYASGGQRDTWPSTSGALLGYTQAQLASYVGQALIPIEGDGTIRAFNPNTNAFTVFSTPTPIPAATPALYQLEGASLVACAPATGCPATQGYWKHHPFATSTLIIGGVTYTDAELVNILNTAPKGGNATLVLMHQLIAALANEAAGAQHVGVVELGVNVDAAITEAESLLISGIPQTGFPGTNPPGVVFPIDLHNSTGTFVSSGTTLGGYFTTLSNVLDAYNSAIGLNCQEASGLTN
jgi:hypothetical protein